MPKKAKNKFKSYRVNGSLSNYSDAEVFRNSSAVLDDTDPHESLQYMKEIFKDKLDEDVIAMIFSECEYNVDQAFENLMALCNEDNVEQSLLGDEELHAVESICTEQTPFLKSDEESSEISSSKESSEIKIESLQHIPGLGNVIERNIHKNALTQSENIEVVERKISENASVQNENTDTVDGNLSINAVSNSNLKFAQMLKNIKKFSPRNSTPSAPPLETESLLPISPENSFNSPDNFFSPTYFEMTSRTKSLTSNESSLGSFSNAYFNASTPQFITPLLPTPIYKSSFRKSGKEYDSPQFSISKNIHTSSFLFSQNDEGRKDDAIGSAIKKIKSGDHVMIILRGLPGSGKSTLGRKLKFSGAVFSTDDFFVSRGKYIFDWTKLDHAHKWNHRRTKKALVKGVTPVIIDNTNVERWEMEPYIALANKFKYQVLILEPNTPWKFNVEELYLRNTHGVPKDKIAKMKERYDHNVTVDTISNSAAFSQCQKDSCMDKIPEKIKKINDPLNSLQIPQNHISLQAVVHQEEEPSDCFVSQNENLPKDRHSSLQDDLNKPNVLKCELALKNRSIADSDSKKTVQPSQSDIYCSSASSNESINNPKESITNLDELRALIREDSEDSQSHNDSVHGSSVDVSGWEAITEHDDDFLWSTSSEDVKNISSLCNNLTNNIKNHKDMNSLPKNSHSLVDVKECIIEDSKNKVIEKFVDSPLSNDRTNVPFIKNVESLERNSEISISNKSLLAEKNRIDSPFQPLFLHATFPNENNSSDYSHIDIKNTHIKDSVYMKEQNPPNEEYYYQFSGDDKSNTEDSSTEKKSHDNRLMGIQNLNLISEANFSIDEIENSDLNLTLSSSLPTLTENNDQFDSFIPKPQRSNLKIFAIEKEFNKNEKLEEKSLHKNNLETNPLYLDSSLRADDCSWESDEYRETENTAGCVNEESSKINENFSSPKPQRIITDNADSLSPKKINTSEAAIKSGENDLNLNKADEYFQGKSMTKCTIPEKKLCGNFCSLLESSINDMSSNWQFPEYKFEDINENFPVEEEILQSKVTSFTQTEPHDFMISHKIAAGDVFSCDYQVLSAAPQLENKILNSKFLFNESEVDKFSDVVTFEKSTSTEDLHEDSEIQEKLCNLHHCFPDICEEDLQHLLELCHGDDMWLSNLLLEWGYKYNVNNSDVIADVGLSTNLQIANETSDTIQNKNSNHITEFQPMNNSQIDNQTEDSSANFNSLNGENNLNELQGKKFQYILSSSKNVLQFSQNAQTSSSKKAHCGNPDSESPVVHSSVSASNSWNKLQFTLDSAFAFQLEELFGPIQEKGSIGSLMATNRQVEIDLEFAKLIHSKWKETVSSKRGMEKQTSHAFRDKRNQLRDKEEMKFVKTKAERNSDEPLPLSEIMDMEYALELHRQEKLRETDVATKLKRLKLYNMFPGADTTALDDIFESNNYNLKNCVLALGEDIGPPKAPDLEKVEEPVEEWKKSDIFKEFEIGDWSEWVYQDDSIGSHNESTVFGFLPTISPEAAELRDLAAKYYRLREQCITKAKQAYYRGMKDAASFYARQGKEHGLKFKQLNKEASELIIQERNVSAPGSVLDLHGLYVPEAIKALEKFLRSRKLEFRKQQLPTPQTLSVITGQGIHSTRGPKIRPSVMEYLRKTGYGFREVNGGVLEVTLILD